MLTARLAVSIFYSLPGVWGLCYLGGSEVVSPEVTTFPRARKEIHPHPPSSGGCPDHPCTALTWREVPLTQSFPQAAQTAKGSLLWDLKTKCGLEGRAYSEGMNWECRISGSVRKPEGWEVVRASTGFQAPMDIILIPDSRLFWTD